MDVRKYWYSSSRSSRRRSRSRSRSRSIRLGRFGNDEEFNHGKQLPSPSNKSSWKLFWMKLFKKDKRKVYEFDSSSNRGPALRRQATYDAYTYAQNFEQGSSWDVIEPDDLARSFSSRFADPSKLFLNE